MNAPSVSERFWGKGNGGSSYARQAADVIVGPYSKSRSIQGAWSLFANTGRLPDFREGSYVGAYCAFGRLSGAMGRSNSSGVR